MTMTIGGRLGEPTARLEARDKVTGVARYAAEEPVEGAAYAWPVPSSIARGRVVRIDASAATALPGVLAVLTHDDAPRLGQVEDAELLLLQGPSVAYRGQVVALVVADSEEVAREAAAQVRVDYAEEGHDVVLTEDHPNLYTPEKINPSYEPDTSQGDVDAALAAAEVTVDQTYCTPPLHNNPMEPHATTARWDGDRLTVWDSTQGTTGVAQSLATLFGLEPDAVHVRAQHVGGGFGSKGSARPNAVLAVMAARVVGRPVRLSLTRQAMFFLVGYRTPTIQHVRLGADRDGRLSAVAHDVVEQSSTIFEFAEQTAVVTRSMYAAPNRRTSHRLARLDVPTPRWMRAPGECPGMFALESAMDELAIATGLDPIELRVRNEPEVDPETGQPFSSRNVLACLREGAARFGWERRDPTPGVRRNGRFLIGTGVACSSYPAMSRPAGARARVDADGRFSVGINATDIGTGARTAMHQIAVDALGAAPGQVSVQIADSTLPAAPVAGGSAGTASWGWAVTKACRELCDLLDRGGGVPPEGLEVTVDTSDDVAARQKLTRSAYGAQFAEVRVDVDSGEVRLARLLGVFAASRIVNPRLARSQFLGGMTMGVSMALLEEGVLDPQFGDHVNHDFASYHIATGADVPQVDVAWIDEDDEHLNPMGIKGIGEIGIVGTAAAVANAVFHATGVRVRDLPVRLDKLLGELPT